MPVQHATQFADSVGDSTFLCFASRSALHSANVRVHSRDHRNYTTLLTPQMPTRPVAVWPGGSCVAQSQSPFSCGMQSTRPARTSTQRRSTSQTLSMALTLSQSAMAYIGHVSIALRYASSSYAHKVRQSGSHIRCAQPAAALSYSALVAVTMPTDPIQCATPDDE
jgi:hypothetical protein